MEQKEKEDNNQVKANMNKYKLYKTAPISNLFIKQGIG